MRRVRWLATLLTAGGILVPILPAMPVVAAEPAEIAKDLETEVRALLDALGGQTRAERVEAEKRLIRLGPKVLPLLPAPELLPTVSVREAVRRIRFELERIAARDSVLPSHVTLDRETTIGDALTEITRQTGNRLDGRSLGEDQLQQRVEFDMSSSLFWKVLDDLAARHQWRYEFDATVRGLKLSPAALGSRSSDVAVSYAGAFRVEALPVERIQRGAGRAKDKKAAEKAAPGDDLLRVTLLIMPEPRLRPLFLQFATSEILARAEGMTNLNPFSPEANLELALGEGTGASPIHLDYLIPKNKASAVVGLKGKLRCTTAAGNELIRFTDLDKARDGGGGGTNIARRRGGVTVTLQRVRITPSSPGKQEARVQIAVTYDTGGPAFESHRSWILHNEVFLEDPAGKRVRLNGGSDTTQQGDGSLGIEYRFIDLPDPVPKYTFVYVAPTLIVDVPIDFEIQSVPVGKK